MKLKKNTFIGLFELKFYFELYYEKEKIIHSEFS